MSRPAVRLFAALSTLAVIGVTTAPAMAAEPAAEASATAAVITLAGSPLDTGSFTSTNDGAEESTSGNNTPELATVLANQENVDLGVLYQDAATVAADGKGTAYACSGVAGNGSAVAAVGDGSCLEGGDAVSLVPGTIDLSEVSLIQSEALAALTDPLSEVLDPVLQQLTTPLGEVLNQALAGLGELGIVVESAGAIQSTCQATSTSASATSNVAALRAYVTFAGQEIDLLNVPVGDLAPNTKAVTNLDAVVQAVIDGLETQLTEGLQGAGVPLTALTDLLTQVNETLVAQLAPFLAPLEENILDITLNKQTRPSDNSIEVTALDVQVLPVAQEFLGSSLASVELGKAYCAGGTYAQTSTTPPAAEEEDEPTPAVPVSVPAGQSGETPAPWGPAAIAGMTVLAVAAGGYRYFSLRTRTDV